jgi:hypothetical protein
VTSKTEFVANAEAILQGLLKQTNASRTTLRASACTGFSTISTRECAKRCAADPGPTQASSRKVPELCAVPGLQRIMISVVGARGEIVDVLLMLHCARDTPVW